MACVQAAKGNVAMSLFLTVVTNMLGVVTVPYMLDIFVGTSSVSWLVQTFEHGPSSSMLGGVTVPYMLHILLGRQANG